MKDRTGVVAWALGLAVAWAGGVQAQERPAAGREPARSPNGSPERAARSTAEDRPIARALPPAPVGPWLGTTGRCPAIVPQYNTAGYPPPFNPNCPQYHPLLRFLYERSAGIYRDPRACPPCGRGRP